MTHGDDKGDNDNNAEQFHTGVNDGIVKCLDGTEDIAAVQISNHQNTECAGQNDFFFEQQGGQNRQRDE